jgi:hypothetical protein
MPVHSRGDKPSVETGIGFVSDEPRLASAFLVQFYLEAVAFGVIEYWFYEPSCVLSVTELVSGVGPNDPLISALFNLRIL